MTRNHAFVFLIVCLSLRRGEGQTWIEQTVLTGSDKQAGDSFGYCISLTDNYAIISAHTADPDSTPNAGAAYIFSRDGITWTQQAILTAGEKGPGHQFGFAAAITDNYALVGVDASSPGSVTAAGSAYIFARVSESWPEQAYLTASDKSVYGFFGAAVALTDNFALVGAWCADPGSRYDAGAAYLFVRDETMWTERQIITASNKSRQDWFGVAVSLTDEYALVGARGANAGSIEKSGAAYIFSRNGTMWEEQSILTASSKAENDYFGFSTSLTNEIALIGLSGSVPRSFIFTRVGKEWKEAQILDAASGERRVTVVNNLILVRNSVFTRAGDLWELQQTLNRPLGESGSSWISPNYVIIGNYQATVGNLSGAGEAYVFFNSVTQSSGSLMTSRQASESKSGLRSLSTSRSMPSSYTSHSPRRTELKDESMVDFMPIIVGSSAGLTGLAAFIYFIRGKLRDKMQKRNAAQWAEKNKVTPGSADKQNPAGINTPNGDRKPPDPLGSTFTSKKLQVSDSSDRRNTTGSRPEDMSLFGNYADVATVAFSKLEPIGAGGFGLVYRVELSMGVVAVKIPRGHVRPRSKEHTEILAEAQFLSRLRHHNITSFLGYGTHSEGFVVFVMEYAESSLADSLKVGPLMPNRLVEFSYGITKGLVYLHAQAPPISHRDLKPENILIVRGVAKLADFGLAIARDFVSKTTGFVGTPVWSPPESFEKRFPGPPGDIYTFGLLLWAMVTGRTPYEGYSHNEVLAAKFKNQVPSIPSSCSADFAKIMKRCWRQNPKERPHAGDIELTISRILRS